MHVDAVTDSRFPWCLLTTSYDLVPSLAVGSIDIILIVPFSTLDPDQQFFGESERLNVKQREHAADHVATAANYSTSKFIRKS